MSQITCTRRIQFAAGHRVWRHEGKCRNSHGHNYTAFFEARTPKLDGIGRVIDFSVLKERIGGWIDEHWDHGFICFHADLEMYNALRKIEGQKLFLLPENPTAENMATFLLHTVCPELLKDTNVEVCRVQLWETENCYAEARL